MSMAGFGALLPPPPIYLYVDLKIFVTLPALRGAGTMFAYIPHQHPTINMFVICTIILVIKFGL